MKIENEDESRMPQWKPKDLLDQFSLKGALWICINAPLLLSLAIILAMAIGHILARL